MEDNFDDFDENIDDEDGNENVYVAEAIEQHNDNDANSIVEYEVRNLIAVCYL